MANLLLSAIVGFIAGLFGDIFRDSYQKRTRKNTLLRALSIDSIGMLLKFETVIPALNKPLGAITGGGDDFKRLSQLPCGVILHPPLDETRELVFLLDHDLAGSVLLLYDHWTRFQIYEERFSAAYAQLADWTARCDDPSQKTTHYELLKAEYWDQVDGMRQEMLRIACDLCKCSCDLFQLAMANSKFTISDRDLKTLSKGMWNSWGEFRAALKKYSEIAATC